MPQYIQTTQNLIFRLKSLAVNQFDIFGQLPSFRVMKKAKYNSIAGFITTLFICGITLIYLTNELVTMITQSEPSVVSSEMQVFETQKFALENDNFTLAVSITNSGGNSIIGNGLYYNLTISHCIRQKTKNETTGEIKVSLTCILLPIEACNASHFTTEKQIDYFSRMRFGAMQCINREYLKQSPPLLQGQLNSITYQFVEVHLRKCINSTEYQKCASNEEQQKVLMSGHYVVYMSDYLMQLNNPSQPYQQIINSDFSGFSLSSSKIIKQYYRIIETTSDDGLLYSNIHTQTNLKQQEWRESTELYNENYMIDHYIALDYRETDYQRTYIKIQTVLSRLGGIWQIFIIIVATIIRPLINNLMNLEIANSLFRFQLENPICPTIMESEAKNYEDKISMPSSNMLPNDFKSQLQLIFGWKNQHKHLFNQAKNKIMEHLDMITIIQKLQQIDILKQILLTNEQQQLLSIIPKPLITLPQKQDHSNNIQLITHINQQSMSQNSYVDSYHKIIQCKNNIDERLINLLDKQTINMLERSLGMANLAKTPGMESKFEDINEPIPLLPK